MNKEERNILINNLDYKSRENFQKKFKVIDEKLVKLKKDEKNLIESLKEETINKILKESKEEKNEY